MLGFSLLVFFACAVLVAVPWWPFSRTWGYAPAGVAAAALLLLLAFAWLGFVVLAWPWTGMPPVPPA